MKKAIVLLTLIPSLAFAWSPHSQPPAPMYRDLGRNERIVLDKGSQYPMTKGGGDQTIVNGRIVRER